MEKKSSLETVKNLNKRTYDEFEDSSFPINNNNGNNGNSDRKKIKIENNNCTSFVKNEKLILTKAGNMSIFNEKYNDTLKEYPDCLKSNIERTLIEMKNEGYLVSEHKIS